MKKPITIRWKDADFPTPLRRYGKHGEYFTAQIQIDPKTGEGTIKLLKP